MIKINNGNDHSLLVTISNYYDQSQIVSESQSSVLEAILVGGVLALIVLMLFLGNLRTAAIVLIILPLTILISFGLMKALGQTSLTPHSSQAGGAPRSAGVVMPRSPARCPHSRPRRG